MIEWITIIGAVANKGLGFGFDHVKVEAQLDQAYFMMICRVRAHRQRKPWRSTIAMIFIPFPRLVGPISAPPPLAIAKVASIKLSSSSNTPLSRSSLATSVRTRRNTSLLHQV